MNPYNNININYSFIDNWQTNTIKTPTHLSKNINKMIKNYLNRYGHNYNLIADEINKRLSFPNQTILTADQIKSYVKKHFNQSSHQEVIDLEEPDNNFFVDGPAFNQNSDQEIIDLEEPTDDLSNQPIAYSSDFLEKDLMSELKECGFSSEEIQNLLNTDVQLTHNEDSIGENQIIQQKMKKKRYKWTDKENEIFIELAIKHKKDWFLVKDDMKERTGIEFSEQQLVDHYSKVPSIKKLINTTLEVPDQRPNFEWTFDLHKAFMIAAIDYTKDWGKVAQILNQQFGVELTKQQVRDHYENNKEAKKNINAQLKFSL